jgi:hypothetical protein
MKAIPWLSIAVAVILGSAVMRMASGTVFGAFALPAGVDPNQIQGELLAVKTIRVGSTDTICVTGSDESGVDYIPVQIPSNMVQESFTEDGETATVRYSWGLSLDDVGIQYIVFSFTDRDPDPLTTFATIVVEVLPPNQAPVVMLCD